MTIAVLDTCRCVVHHENNRQLTLVAFLRKCDFHKLSPDATAWAEIQSAGVTRVAVTKAARLAMYGSTRNPEKYEDGPSPIVELVVTAGNKRTVVVDQSSIPLLKRASVSLELLKLNSEHPIELKAALRG